MGHINSAIRIGELGQLFQVLKTAVGVIYSAIRVRALCQFFQFLYWCLQCSWDTSLYADGGIPPQQGQFVYRQHSSAMVVDDQGDLTGGKLFGCRRPRQNIDKDCLLEPCYLYPRSS